MSPRIELDREQMADFCRRHRIQELSLLGSVPSGKSHRLTWYIASASINGRRLAVAGWNIPLARPTGLGAEGETVLGQKLREELRKHGWT